MIRIKEIIKIRNQQQRKQIYNTNKTNEAKKVSWKKNDKIMRAPRPVGGGEGERHKKERQAQTILKMKR